jgi:hypothetical protein
MFRKNLPALLEKGIPLTKIMNSNVFTYTFDYDEWPMTHYCDETVIKPYNESVFVIR